MPLPTILIFDFGIVLQCGNLSF